MYDCIVIGGGVVGTAVLDALSTRGYKALLIEKKTTWRRGQAAQTAA